MNYLKQKPDRSHKPKGELSIYIFFFYFVFIWFRVVCLPKPIHFSRDLYVIGCELDMARKILGSWEWPQVVEISQKKPVHYPKYVEKIDEDGWYFGV